MDVNGEPKPAARRPGLREQVTNDGPIEHHNDESFLSTFRISTSTKKTLSIAQSPICTNECSFRKSEVFSCPNACKSVQFSTFRLISRRFYMSILLFTFFFLLVRTGSAATLKSTCKKVGYKTYIDETGCELMAVFVNRCSGYCLSFSFANPLRGNQLSVYGKCCRMLDVEMIDVTVNCRPYNKVVQVPSAKECGCFDCA